MQHGACGYLIVRDKGIRVEDGINGISDLFDLHVLISDHSLQPPMFTRQYACAAVHMKVRARYTQTFGSTLVNAPN